MVQQGNNIRLSSKQGIIVLNPDSKTLTSSHSETPIPFKKISGIEILWEANKAGWQELLFEGTDVFDLLPAYRDRVNKAALVLVCDDKKIPVLVAAQYEVRDFLDITTPLLHAVLKACGSWQKIDDFIEAKKDHVKTIASSVGLPLIDLDRDWSVG